VQSSYHASFWIAALVGLASGSVGPFILLRKMALVGDALSHVALPGIALALLLFLPNFLWLARQQFLDVSFRFRHLFSPISNR